MKTVSVGTELFRADRQTDRDDDGNTVRSESRCVPIKYVGSDIQESLYSKILIKQLHTLPVLHFNRCLTTGYNETTAHFNGNFDTDKQIYAP
jgi:hypothetical protein